MKNFFKKLSFVLAVAMVLTSVAPATASAAAKNYIYKSGKDSALTSVNVWFGDKATDLNVKINGKKNVAGTWKVGNTKVATVDKNGVITPVANGTTTVKFTAKTGEAVKVQVVVGTRVKTVKPYLADDAEKTALTELALNIGDEKEIKLGLGVSATAAKAGAKTTSMVTAAKVDGTAVEVVKGAGQRTFTVKAVEAGEATITIGAHKTTALVEAGKFFKSAEIKVTVADGLAITDLKADKVNVLTATFASAVDTEDVTVSVVKGANAVDAKVEWNADKTVATITTTAKMTEGTYTVKAVSTKDATVSAEKSVDIVSQYVKEIQILNDIALTDKGTLSGGGTADAALAYVYYKVVDQYGEDLTASTSIQWSTSCGEPVVSRSLGRLTLKRSDNKAFTYGEQIYVTGVYTKTGVSGQATLTVGTAQALHTIEMAGFVKKNSTTLVQSLPAGFKSGEYYLVYDAMDQNNNTLTPAAKWGEEVTFISDNVLVVREIKGGDTTLVINGHEYNAVMVTPGDYVSNGGEINVTAIATKTGNKTVHNYVVGTNHILTSFSMSAPVGLTLDGECFEIPFEALDQNGEKITNFITIADNLNKISFTVSEVGAQVEFVANDDGTASLYYVDRPVAWTESYATDGIDRTVSVTTVVVGGNSDNLLLSISDKARPDAIKSEAMGEALLEGGTASVGNLGIYGKTFTFIDQYGREMKNSSTANTSDGYDFFESSLAGGIQGTEFKGYTFNVVAEYKGSDDATNLSNNGSYLVNLANQGCLTINAAAKTKTALTGNTIKYTIAKAKVASNAAVSAYEDVTTAYNKTFAVVDINQVKNFTVADLNKQYVNTEKTSFATGELASLTSTNINDYVTTPVIKPGYEQKVTVKGTYNGISVTVPTQYYTVVGGKLTTSTPGALGNNKISAVSGNSIRYSDLYDVNTAKYLRKDTSDSVKVTIYEVYVNEAIPASGVAIGDYRDLTGTTCSAILKDSVVKNVAISDAAPYLAKINAPETKTVNPDKTDFSAESILLSIEAANHFWLGHDNAGECTFVDQYGVAFLDTVSAAGISYKISSIVEAEGYADNNFTVSGNDTRSCAVEGAECGDTFVLTITATDGYVTLTKDVKITVGADKKAEIVNGNNYYVDLLKPVLETQRQNSLK